MRTYLPFGWNDVDGRWLFVHHTGCFDATGVSVDDFVSHVRVSLDSPQLNIAALERELNAPQAPVILSVLAACTATMLMTPNRLAVIPCALTFAPSDAALALVILESMFDVPISLPGLYQRHRTPAQIDDIDAVLATVRLDATKRNSGEAFVRSTDINIDMLRGICASIVTFAHPDNRSVDEALMSMNPHLDVGLRIIEVWSRTLGVRLNPHLVASVRDAHSTTS